MAEGEGHRKLGSQNLVKDVPPVCGCPGCYLQGLKMRVIYLLVDKILDPPPAGPGQVLMCRLAHLVLAGALTQGLGSRIRPSLPFGKQPLQPVLPALSWLSRVVRSGGTGEPNPQSQTNRERGSLELHGFSPPPPKSQLNRAYIEGRPFPPDFLFDNVLLLVLLKRWFWFWP